MTTIGDELKRLIPEGKAQKAVAMEWLDTWRRGHPEREALTTDTVESRLSECLKNRPPGIKFFFSSPARRETTFETFGLSQPAREQLNQLADGVLSTERPVRLIVDVSAGPQASAEAEAMLASIKQRFLGEDALFPMVLVLTERQYDRLPRSFDDLKDRLTVEKVPTAAAGQALAKSLAGTEALLVSPRPQLPFERWAALRFDKTVEIDPPDALALFRSVGALPGLPPVTRPLARIAEEQDTPMPMGDAFAVRKLMLTLTQGEEIPVPTDPWGRRGTAPTPGSRLSWARTLGIEAAATPKEWAAALPKRIEPLKILVDVDKLLPLALSFANYEHVAAVAFRRGQELHLINPPELVRAEIEGMADIEVHDITAHARPMLDDLMHDVAALSRDDLLDDPFLERLFDGYADEDDDDEVLLTARAALVLSGVLRPPRPAPVQDFRTAMKALLDGTEMEAQLRLDVVAASTTLNGRSWRPFVAPRAYLDDAVKRGAAARLPPLANVTFCRGEEIAAVRLTAPDSDHGSVRPLAGATQVGVPLLEGSPDRWADELLTGLRRRVRQELSQASQIHLPDWYVEKVTLRPSEWSAADRELAFLLASLRAAISTATALPLPSDAVLLALSNGIFAEIRVREHPSSADEAPVATLIRPMKFAATSYLHRQDAWSLSPLTELVPMYAAETHGYGGASTELGARLPHGVDLSGRGFRADITFHASPLFAGMSTGTMLEAAAVAGGAVLDQARRDDDERQADDD